MTNSDLYTSVQDLLDDNGEEYPNTKVAKFLRLASREITNDPGIKRFLFPSVSDSTTLVSGQTEYDLPSDHDYDVNQVIYNPGSSQRILGWVDFSEIADYNYSGVYRYSVRAGQLVIAGTPTDADEVPLTIYYSAVDSNDYNNASTEGTLGKKYPMLLIYKAAQLLSMTSPDTLPAADRFEKLFEANRERALEEAEEKQVSETKYQVETDYPESL